jgi:serine/threonine protein phosphatase PrpC
VKFLTSSLSKIGGRHSNQDYCDFISLRNRHCWVVADGLGGHKGGEIASRLAVEEIIRQFTQYPDCSLSAIKRYIESAQNIILQRQKAESELATMRTTITVLISDNRKVLWGHVGDTRLYFFRSGKIIFQSKDHSVPQALADAGEISPEQIRFHEDRNRLLRALGSDGDLRPTFQEEKQRVKHDDAFLLCTDGFWEYVSEGEMENTLKDSPSPDVWLKNMENILLDKVQEKHDNYSAIVIFAQRQYFWER